MFTGLLHTHSLLRYIFLVLILITLYKSFIGWRNKYGFTEGDKKTALFTLITAHLQLVLGLVIYFLSPTVSIALADMGAAMKEPSLRFWAVEHISMVVLGIAILTVGYSSSKRQSEGSQKHKRIFIFYLIALILIFLAIPWPWSSVARGWMPGM